MRTTTADIRTLIDKIDRGDIRLPEIQRGYVWKPPKIAGLIDSLYRRYPTGSLLLWETDEDVTERDPAIQGPSAKPMAKPQYLIDGQQRLTSLHRVFKGHDDAQIVFNVETQRFQRESAATKRDARWIAVSDVLNEASDVFSLVEELRNRLDAVEPKLIGQRLDRLRKIADYQYWIEILDDLPYEVVADIFVRVNSRGVRLSSVDLALATLSARWRGVIKELEAEAERWAAVGYPAISVGFLARSIASSAADTGSFRVFASAPLEHLHEGWKDTKRGVEHLVQLLKSNAGIATSELLPSENALVPLVAFLGRRPDQPLDAEMADGILYWLFAAFIQSRYSTSVETVLGQDLAAVRSSDPLGGLLRNLRLFGQRLTITEDTLAGRTDRSPYFLLSFLAAKRSGARDWWHGVDLCTDGQGHFKLEYHHIHPRATLKAQYSKTEINDLANLAFISSKANRKISDRSPANYFPEIGEEQLTAHLVPLDEELRTPDTYPDFVRARRGLLAAAMTKLLIDLAPSALAAAPATEDSATGERLILTTYGESADDPRAVLVLDAHANGTTWQTSLPLRDLNLFVTDLENGFASGITISGEAVELESGAEAIELPVGPLLVRGTIPEWRTVLDREIGDMAGPDERPPVEDDPSWERERMPFPVVDSE
jgi:hypothetical protein